jgi:TolB protein
VADIRTGSARLVFASTDLVVEAPNCTPDGRFIVFNAAGSLYRIAADGSGDPVRIDTGWLDDNNNDHLVSADGSTIYSSSEVSGALFAIPFAGGVPRQISNDRAAAFGCFLQGISPDGATLAYTGAEQRNGRAFAQSLYTIPAAGGDDVLLSSWDEDSVGCEYSPDGHWLFFTSELGASRPGHMQLYRMRVDGSDRQQLTHDERVNWFPKVAPDGRCLVYLSFPPGTRGHEANVPVIIRSMRPDGTDRRDVVHVFGGQGTLNVNSWAPDSTHFAYVDYPLSQ